MNFISDYMHMPMGAPGSSSMNRIGTAVCCAGCGAMHKTLYKFGGRRFCRDCLEQIHRVLQEETAKGGPAHADGNEGP